MQKITPFLWFDNQAEEAAKFYISLFKNSRILDVMYYNKPAAKASGRPKDSVLTVKFRLAGQEFVALNGGPHFKFTEALSFVVNCTSQKEVDYYWRKLSAGGKEGQCGWLKDKYGVSWQIIPTALIEMLMDSNARKSQNVMQALLQMTKIDIRKAKKAYNATETPSKTSQNRK
jgi:predicted 3-demethylubiquinone-9 3-methyltransferase (glyoxalase superfamily)